MLILLCNDCGLRTDNSPGARCGAKAVHTVGAHNIMKRVDRTVASMHRWRVAGDLFSAAMVGLWDDVQQQQRVQCWYFVFVVLLVLVSCVKNSK